MSRNRGRPKLSNSGLILKVSGTPFFDVLNHTVSVETHRKMKAANTSCATVVQQITSEDATVTHAFHVLKGWNDVYYLSKDSRPAPREHHEQRQVNLPRQVQVGGQVLVFRCGKEEDPAMLSDYAMPIHIQRLNLRMTLQYAWCNQPLYLQDHSCPTKALQRLTQVTHLFLKQPSVIQPENLRPVLKLVQRPFVANVLEKLTI